MLLHIADEFRQVCAWVIPGALVMHISKRPLDRVGAGALGREKQQLDAGMTRQPLPSGFGVMDMAILHDDRQAPIPGAG